MMRLVTESRQSNCLTYVYTPQGLDLELTSYKNSMQVESMVKLCNPSYEQQQRKTVVTSPLKVKRQELYIGKLVWSNGLSI